MGFVLASGVFAQTADYAYSAVIREARSYVNSCGPEGAPQIFINALDWASGNPGACVQHDIEYGTLGFPKARADMNLGEALYIDTLGEEHPVIATIFWGAVSEFGEGSYNDAQLESKEEFRRIHHGNNWSPAYGMWHPSDGHVQRSFPQCIESCYY